MSNHPQIVQSWREYRTCSEKQILALDFLTNQGTFVDYNHKTPHVFFGGAAAGGKSHLARTASFELNSVLREKGFPNMWGVIYCDTMPNLRDRHIVKFQEEFSGFGEFKDTAIRGPHFSFFEEGLGGVYLRYVGENTRRGTEFAWIWGEELTEWQREWFEQVMYTARLGKNLPFFARGFNSNPDGPGHHWVKEIFVPEYRNLDDPYIRSVGSNQFLYVPALKTDNPIYGTDWGRVIDANLAVIRDDDIREARTTGSWEIYGSGRFPKFRREIHCFDWHELFEKHDLPTNLDPAEFLRYCHRHGFDIYASLDYGTSIHSISAYLLHLVDPYGRPWTFFELGMSGLELEEQAQKIHAAERGMIIRRRFADPAIGGRSAEREDQRTRQERFAAEGLWFELGVNDRVEGAATVASLLYWSRNDLGTFEREPQWRILRTGCPGLVKEIPNLARDKGNPEDVDKNQGRNHWYDSARYFLHTRFMGGNLPQAEIVEGSAAYWRALGERRPRTSLF